MSNSRAILSYLCFFSDKMSFIRTLIFLVALFLVSACRQHYGPNTVLTSDLQARMAMDSIRLIDSLVLVNRVKDFALSAKLAMRSLELAKIAGTDEALIKAYNNLGNSWSLSRMDSAFYYYSKAFGVKPDQANYFEKPMLLYNIAMLYVAASNNQKAIVLLDSALCDAEQRKNYIVVSNALNSLGNIYNDIENKLVAIKFYDSAFRVARHYQLPLQAGVALGNLAAAALNSDSSVRFEGMAINYLKLCKDGAGPLASIYINTGMRNSNPDTAIFYYQAAIGLINKENAPLTLLGAYNNLVYSYLEKGDVQRAKQYLIDFAFPLSKEIQNDVWIANLYDTYADVMIAEGKLNDALHYEKKSIELSGQAEKKEADKQVRLLGAMLDLKNKETIARKAQQEAQQTRTTYEKVRFLFAIAILVTLFLVISLAFFLVRNIAFTRGKLISAAKKIILVEENEKAVLGRDLHDLTGHHLVNLSNFMESASFVNPAEKETGLKMSEDFKEHMQKISRRFKRSWLEKFDLGKNLEAICREIIRYNQVNLYFTLPDQYPVISKDVEIHLCRIVQELLTNASKYAKHAHVVLDLSVKNGNLHLRYADDGKGFDAESVSETGIGIINVQERVRLLNGSISLDTRPGFGVNWEISVPVNNKLSALETWVGGTT